MHYHPAKSGEFHQMRKSPVRWQILHHNSTSGWHLIGIHHTRHNLSVNEHMAPLAQLEPIEWRLMNRT